MNPRRHTARVSVIGVRRGVKKRMNQRAQQYEPSRSKSGIEGYEMM